MLSAPICWLGGKSRLRSTIISKLPDDHTCYAEIFGGAGWVLFGKQPSKVEVYNDINGDLTNLYRIIKTAHRAFIEALDLILVSRKLFTDFINTDPDSLNEIQRAVRFYYLTKVCFGSDGTHFGYSNKVKSSFSANTLEKTIRAIYKRLQGVYIEEKSFGDIIPRYDGPKTFFYLDPPYYETATYQHKMAYKDYELLVEILSSIKGCFLLSINDHPKMRNLFKGYSIEEVEVPYSIGRDSKSRVRYGELLISNY